MWTYESFVAVLEDKEHPKHKQVKGWRALGKKLNFTAEYGAMAPKVAATLMVSEEEAQIFLDAREAMFQRVQEWKDEIVALVKRQGYVTTMLGARRHLRDALMSEDRFEASKAERQAINYEVQGSCAEQTKEAEGRMWEESLFFRYDAVCYGPVHDELVMSVMIEDLPQFLPEAHACMTVQYAGMKVPCVGSISFGPNFFDQIEIGTEPTPEAIEEGLRKLRGEPEPELAEAA
jgi:DNA polymerase-1